MEPSLHATALGVPWEAPHSGGPGEPPNRAGHSPLEKSPPGPMGPLQQSQVCLVTAPSCVPPRAEPSLTLGPALGERRAVWVEPSARQSPRREHLSGH